MTFKDIENASGASSDSNNIDVNKIRRVLAQALASSAKNLLIFNFGLSMAFPMILIPALSGLNVSLNPDEKLRISSDESTWIASITSICQPIGSLVSPYLTDSFGRKKTMLFMNIPFGVAWILLYFSPNLIIIYIAMMILGLALGGMEASIFIYTAECSESSIRGTLLATTGIFVTLASSLVCFLGNNTSWRTAALISSIIPMVAFICISLVPESPIWLISKNKPKRALKSLQWLRGWVSPEQVETEFTEMTRYQSTSHELCEQYQSSIIKRLRDLFRYQTFYPFIMICSQFILCVFSGFAPYRPYLVQVLIYYETPIDPNSVASGISWTGIAANIILLVSLRPMGKRQIYLWSLAVSVLMNLFLGIYGLAFLSNDVTSFEVTETINYQQKNEFLRLLPLYGFYILSFASNIGLCAIPNIMLAELFELKTKALATGLSAAIFYISTFICAKTFQTIETIFTLPGLAFLYAIIGIFGYVGMFRVMPETEGKSLAEIESHFMRPNNMDSMAPREKRSMNMKVMPELKRVSAFRRLLPQFLASSAKNFLIWNLGLILAFPSIVIPSLTGLSTTINPNETLQITAPQASWLASSVFIGQPIGSLFSAFLTDSFGRKRALLLVNIPNIIAWMLLAETNSLPLVYLAFILFGYGAGLMEAPIMVYLGEICEPSIRGFLSACAGISSSMGIFMVFLLGSLFSWRQVASICAIIPITTMIAVFFVPESPIWLLSKGRDAEALKSLQWLRGWVSSDAVSIEFFELQRYNESSNSCSNCEKLLVKCMHSGPSIWDRIKDIKRQRTLKPFILISCLYILMEFSSYVMRPYIVQILNAYGIPLDTHLTTVILGSLGVFANICLLATIKFFGKRKIYLCSTVVTFLSCFALSIYGFCSLPPGWNSFRAHSNVTSISQSNHAVKDSMGQTSYVPLCLFLVQHFAVSIGVSSMANIYMGEVFPFKSRSFLCGIAAANRYVLATIATKTYYNIELWLSLSGSMAFYGLISLIGFIIMYRILPETEGRSLEDIEFHYSNDRHRMTDINIRINKK